MIIITTNKTVTIDADEGGEGTCVCNGDLGACVGP